ncbi:MAG: PQQ-dependent sugar dehydrogenase [Trueperaceae bacterium]
MTKPPRPTTSSTAIRRQRRRPQRLRGFALFLVILAAIAGISYVALARWAAPGPDTYRRAPADVAVELVPVARGLVEPLHAVVHPDGVPEVFVVEKRGAIWRLPLLDAGVSVPAAPQGEPFLDLRGEVATDAWERGMYTLAFHPAFSGNGRFFVAYTAVPDGSIVVEEHRVDATTGRANLAARREILRVEKPINPDGTHNDSHNGGHISFGPNDGFLYVSIGDGNRPRLTDLGPQELDNLRGKILRIDVDVDGVGPYGVPQDNPFFGVEGARTEIWAYGLRNPWRFVFDPDGTTLWVGDVGQNEYEELDRVTAGGNYGWPIREGRSWSWRDNLKAMGITKDTWHRVGHVADAVGRYFRYVGRDFEGPVLDYAQVHLDPEGGQSILAGLVYEGSRLPQLRGRFLFGDFVTGRMWSFAFDGDEMPVRYDLLESGGLPSSFLADAEGEVLVTDYGRGELLRLVPMEGSL